MSITAAALRELHRLHQQLADLRGRLDRGPKQIRVRAVNLAQAEERLLAAQAEVKSSRIALDQKQLQLKTGEAKIVDLRGKLNACSSNREYQALTDQIAAAEMANSVLSDEILEAMERLDELRKGVGDCESLVAKAKEELTKIQQTVQMQEQSLTQDVRRVEANLLEAERALPADFRDAYRRVVNAKNEDAMAPVEGESCGGCFQQLTPNMMSDLALSKIVFCKVCGRLLYTPEDRSPGRAK